MGKNISFVNVAELLIIQEDMKFMNGKKKFMIIESLK